MNDSLLMGVLHGLADRDKQLYPLNNWQAQLIAELRDRNAVDQFHHEIRQTCRDFRPWVAVV